jgi:hypothetical protein
VFLSYSRADRKGALAIVRVLEAAGYGVWWDGLLEGGERFSRTTEAALAGARAVVVLWSKTSAGSHWVHDEATRGRESGRLVPLSLDGSLPPLGFGQFQSIDVSHALGKPGSEPMRKLLRAVAALHEGPAPALPCRVPSWPRRRAGASWSPPGWRWSRPAAACCCGARAMPARPREARMRPVASVASRCCRSRTSAAIPSSAISPMA